MKPDDRALQRTLSAPGRRPARTARTRCAVDADSRSKLPHRRYRAPGVEAPCAAWPREHEGPRRRPGPSRAPGTGSGSGRNARRTSAARRHRSAPRTATRARDGFLVAGRTRANSSSAGSRRACRPEAAFRSTACCARGEVAQPTPGADFAPTPCQAPAGSRPESPPRPPPSAGCCTTSVACTSRSRNRRGGIVGPNADLLGQRRRRAVRASPVRRSRAPTRLALPATTLRTTVAVAAMHQHVGAPRSSIAGRPEIASRWAWLLVRAMSTRSSTRQPRRLREHRRRDRDLVVLGEAAHRFERRIARPAPGGGTSSARGPWPSISTTSGRARRRTARHAPR